MSAQITACYADTMRMTLAPFRLLLISLAGYLTNSNKKSSTYCRLTENSVDQNVGDVIDYWKLALLPTCEGGIGVRMAHTGT